MTPEPADLRFELDPLWEGFRRDLQRFVRRRIPEDGVPEAELLRTEKRLRLRLPSALREYYLGFGAPNEINTAHDRLLSPEDLYVQDQLLVFYVENQGVCVWGIWLADAAQNNPPVWRAANESPQAVELDSDDTVSFFRAMLRYQIVRGHRFSAFASDIPVDVEKRLGGLLEDLAVPGSHWKDVRFFGAAGQLCAAVPGEGLFAMGRDRSELDHLARRLKLTWAATEEEVLEDESRRISAEEYARQIIAAGRNAVQQAREKSEDRKADNRACAMLARRLLSQGLRCPHCDRHSRSHRFFDEKAGGRAHFICDSCGCSFDATSFERR